MFWRRLRGLSGDSRWQNILQAQAEKGGPSDLPPMPPGGVEQWIEREQALWETKDAGH